MVTYLVNPLMGKSKFKPHRCGDAVTVVNVGPSIISLNGASGAVMLTSFEPELTAFLAELFIIINFHASLYCCTPHILDVHTKQAGSHMEILGQWPKNFSNIGRRSSAG